MLNVAKTDALYCVISISVICQLISWNDLERFIWINIYRTHPDMRSEFRQACRTGFKTEGLVYAGFCIGCRIFDNTNGHIRTQRWRLFKFPIFLCVNSVSNAENFLLLFLHFCQIYKCKNKRMIINNREMYFKHYSTLIYELVTIHLGI